MRLATVPGVVQTGAGGRVRVSCAALSESECHMLHPLSQTVIRRSSDHCSARLLLPQKLIFVPCVSLDYNTIQSWPSLFA